MHVALEFPQPRLSRGVDRTGAGSLPGTGAAGTSPAGGGDLPGGLPGR